MRALVLGLKSASPGPSSLSTSLSSSSPSSSSHLIFSLHLTRRMRDGAVKESCLQTVDLGSAVSLQQQQQLLLQDQESGGAAAATGNTRRTRANVKAVTVKANVSLAALDRCVDALADATPTNARAPSLGEPNPQGIPYRDSKLTWLLRDALGGAAGQALVRTTFVGVCTAEPQQLPNAINTLRFAHRCRQARMWVTREDQQALFAIQDQLPPSLQQPQSAATPATLQLLDKVHATGGDDAVSSSSSGGTSAPSKASGGAKRRQHHDHKQQAPLPSSPELMSSTMSAMKLGPDESDSTSSSESEDDEVVEQRPPTVTAAAEAAGSHEDAGDHEDRALYASIERVLLANAM